MKFSFSIHMELSPYFHSLVGEGTVDNWEVLYSGEIQMLKMCSSPNSVTDSKLSEFQFPSAVSGEKCTYPHSH